MLEDSADRILSVASTSTLLDYRAEDRSDRQCGLSNDCMNHRYCKHAVNSKGRMSVVIEKG